MAAPWENDPIVQPAAQAGPPAFIPGAVSPIKQAAEARAQHGEARQDNTAAATINNLSHDNANTDKNNRINNPQTLRKEFMGLPEVKAYTVATQQLAQALRTGSGPQADLSLTYAFAKAMDPDSVVRESEQASVAGSQAWLDAAVENAKKQFGMDAAGNYTPKARAALRQQIIRSVASRKDIYNLQRKNFSDIASRNSIDPVEVIGPHVGEAFRDQARTYDQSRRAAGATVGDPLATHYNVDPAEARRLLSARRAEFEQQIAGLPAQAKDVGRRQFNADPRIKGLLEAARGRGQAPASSHPPDITDIMRRNGVHQ